MSCRPGVSVIVRVAGLYPMARARTTMVWPETRPAGMLTVKLPAGFAAAEMLSSSI